MATRRTDMEFQGFARPDGLVGVRNTILVIATADCAEPAAQMMTRGIKGAAAVTQYQGLWRKSAKAANQWKWSKYRKLAVPANQLLVGGRLCGEWHRRQAGNRGRASV